MKIRVLGALLVASSACSSGGTADVPVADAGVDTATPPVDGATDIGTDVPGDVAADAPGDATTPADGGGGGSFTLRMPDVALAPGNERTVCVELPLGNPDATLIRHIHVSLAPGSHHLIVYRSTATAPNMTPTPCPPLGGVTSGTAPLFIAQATESDLTMPAGVGLQLGAHQLMRVEEHFLNTTAAPITGTGTVTVDTAPAGSGLMPADLLFWGTTAINVPAHATGHADRFGVPRAGTHIFGLTAHEHHYGTLTTITQAATATAMGTELYRNTNWAEPPLRQFDPPLVFDGSSGLALHCEYNNTGNTPVSFGESAATAEMCFFWAYYYPSHGFDVMF